MNLITVDQRERIMGMITTGKSQNTAKTYRYHLGKFFEWWQESGRFAYDTVCKAAVNEYKQFLIDNGKGAGTINMGLTTIRRFFLEAADNGLFPAAAAAAIGRVESARNQRKQRKYWLSGEQMSYFFNAIKGYNEHETTAIKDQVLCGLCLLLGLRASEATNISVKDFLFVSGRWSLEVTGKGNKTRFIDVPEWFKLLIDRWLDIAGFSQGYILRPVHYNGRVMTEQPKIGYTGLHKRIRVLTRFVASTVEDEDEAAAYRNIKPHSLRRSVATSLRLNGAELEEVRDFLGHSSVQTTERYLMATAQRERPLANLINLTGE